MDGVLKDGRTGKLWLCKKENGHVLGVQIRVRSENNVFIDQLVLFRHAVLPGCEKKAEIMTTVDGNSHEIKCSICNTKRTWWMGAAALDRFIDARRGRRSKVPA